MNIVSDASSPVEASVCDMFLDEVRIWSPHLAARMGELPGVMWFQVNFSGHQFAYVGKTNLDIVLSVNTHFLTTSLERHNLQFSSVQSLSHVWLFTTPWIAACQAFLSITNSGSLLKLMSMESVMPSHPLSSPSPLAFNHSQCQGLFKWVSSSHQVAKVLEFQLQYQSFQWIYKMDFL